MKNKQMIFRGASVMILAMLWLLPVSLMAQQQNNETKAERKERQKSEQNQRYLKARQAILDSAFVVRAESLQFRDGVMYLPAPTIWVASP